MARYSVTLRSSIASGSMGRAPQRSHRWRTSHPTVQPVTVRKVKVTA